MIKTGMLWAGPLAAGIDYFAIRWYPLKADHVLGPDTPSDLPAGIGFTVDSRVAKNHYLIGKVGAEMSTYRAIQKETEAK